MKQNKQNCNHQWQFARDENKKGHLICDKCGKEECIESNISKPEVRKSIKNPNKYYTNPLDENSTLNMDKGGSEGGGLFPIVPPATNVHPKKCNHVEGEIEGYDNFGMYHIGSGVCKKCGRSMIDWNKPYGTYLKRTDNMDKGGQGESRKVGGHSYSPKPPNVRLKNLPKRPLGNPIDFPQELGYECPNCKSKDLDWSEYQYFVWCNKCQRDYPAVLSMPVLEKAIEIYLEIITDKK